MNHINDVVGIENVNNLQVIARFCLATDEKLAVTFVSWVRSGRTVYYIFRFLCGYVVARDVLLVRGIPSEFHKLTI